MQRKSKTIFGTAKFILIILAVVGIICAGIFIWARIRSAYGPRLDNFSEYKEDFLKVASEAKDYYADNKADEEWLTLDLDKEHEWASEEVAASIEVIYDLGLWYLWVSEDYVVFWEDETKYYGILYAESPKKVIKSMRKDYVGMEYTKIEDEWYEVGQLHGR